MTSADCEQAAFLALKEKKKKGNSPGPSKPEAKPKPKAKGKSKPASAKKDAKGKQAKKPDFSMYKVEKYKSSIDIKRKFTDKKRIGSLRPQAKPYDRVLEFAENLCSQLTVAIQNKTIQQIKEIEVNIMEGAYQEDL